MTATELYVLLTIGVAWGWWVGLCVSLSSAETSVALCCDSFGIPGGCG